jgi:hypothetical protein
MGTCFNTGGGNTRSRILIEVEQSLAAGDYEVALILADLLKSRDDPKLKALITKAEALKREAAERANQQKVAPGPIH